MNTYVPNFEFRYKIKEMLSEMHYEDILDIMEFCGDKLDELELKSDLEWDELCH